MSARALVVANPIAGSCTPELVDAVERRCAQHVRQVTTVWTEGPDAAVALVEQALADARTEGAPLDLVVAVGGDGTVREVAEGIARAGGAWPDGDVAERPALLVIPSGGGNSTYRALWGERAWEDAVEEALGLGRTVVRTLDLARIAEDERATLLGYNTGLLGRIAELRRASRGNAGEETYYAAIQQAIEELESYPQRVTVDGRVLYEGSTMMTTVGGVRRFGRGAFELLPRSVLDDGVLDICVIGEVPRELFGEFAALISTGGHLERAEVEYAQGARVTIERLDGKSLVAEHDGDTCPTGSVATIEIVPRAVPALAAL
ncbi:MAG: diacylglycerol/lipid kinase family protein [Gaiellaceae bacterium]